MANIANTDELIDTISDLTTQITLPSGTFSGKMDSSETNALFSGIEETLNKLYEKVRLLEDIHNFTQKYIENEFAKNQAGFNKAMAAIQQSTDLYQQTRRKQKSVSFAQGEVVNDRNGVPIETAKYINGSTIIPQNTTITTASISSVVSSSESGLPYRRITNPPERYKSFHVDEAPCDAPITESVTFYLSNPVDANFIDVSPFNAKIKSMKVMKADGEKEIDLGKGNGTTCDELKQVSIVQVELECMKSDIVDMEIPAENSAQEADKLDSVLTTVFEAQVKKNGGAVNVY